MAEGQDRRIVLPDGRAVMLRIYGPDTGLPVLALHGTPGSRTKYAMGARTAADLGLRLISVDRWGYGGTDAPRRPSLKLYAEDMAHVADALSLDRFGVIGISGGGPFAAAVAAILGQRVQGLALVGPVGPIAGTPVVPALTPFHTLCFRVLPPVPGAIRLVFGAFRVVLSMSSTGAMRIVSARADKGDKRLLLWPETRDSLAACFRLGLATSLAGPVIDMQLFSRPWDVDLQRIATPTRLWLGDVDFNVPQTAAKGLARQIPDCALVPLKGHGHFWITQNYGEILMWLATVMRGSEAAPHETDPAT